jgi:hypothetical protein
LLFLHEQAPHPASAVNPSMLRISRQVEKKGSRT